MTSYSKVVKSRAGSCSSAFTLLVSSTGRTYPSWKMNTSPTLQFLVRSIRQPKPPRSPQKNDKMTRPLKSILLVISVIFFLLLVAISYETIFLQTQHIDAFRHNWNAWRAFNSPPKPAPEATEQIVQRISHQAASDPAQDVLPDNATWYDADGTPQFYSAWRAKPGLTSAEPTLRSALRRYGARVACWPSAGGVWIKDAEFADLDFLGISRWVNTPRPFPISQTEEDLFCKRLQLVGAQWWRLPAAFDRREHLGKDQFVCDTLETCFEPDIKRDYLIAWAEDERVACYIPIADTEKQGDERTSFYYLSCREHGRSLPWHPGPRRSMVQVSVGVPGLE